MKKPLAGITVLDLSRLLPGGFASLLLSDLGARVIKIEQPQVGDYYRAMVGTSDRARFFIQQFENLNHGKESLGLDLKFPEGREVLKKLVKKADVVLESFRPGVLQKLGVGPAALLKINPKLIGCSITGFDDNSPYRHLAGHDSNYLGLSGLLDRLCDANGRPVLPDFQVVDLTAAYDAVTKILAALVARSKNKGSWIKASMEQGGLSLARVYFEKNPSGKKPSELGGGLVRYSIYETADGRWMTLGSLEPKFWEKFCRLIGREEWSKNSHEYRPLGDEIRRELQNIFRSKPQSEWTELGKKEDICLFPVLSIQDVALPPQRKVPKLGEHTPRILKSLGFKSGDVKKFREKGIIA